MADVPQPASEPYSSREHVQIYLGPDDPDSHHHGTVCTITDVHTDDLDEETGRSLDAYSYTLQPVDGDDELPITFLHWDLVPADQ